MLGADFIVHDAEKAVVMVAGGAGYVGSHVVLALLDAGHQVIVIDNLSSGFRHNVDPRARFFEGDTDNASLVRNLMMLYQIRAVIHCVGADFAPDAAQNPLKYYQSNTSAARSLIESAVASGVDHFILSSTAKVYAPGNGDPIREGAMKRTGDPYASSRLMAETIIADASAAHPLNHGILRYFHAVGADPKMRAGPSSPVVPHLIKWAVGAVIGLQHSGSYPATNCLDQDAACVQDYVHVSDLANAYLLLLNWLIDHPEENLELNCGYGHGFSDEEVVAAVERITSISIARDVPLRNADRPCMQVVDNSSILAKLDWKPDHDDLDIMIDHSYRWEKQYCGVGVKSGPSPMGDPSGADAHRLGQVG